MSELDLDAIEQRAKYEATTFSRESWRFDTVALMAEVRALRERVATLEDGIRKAIDEMSAWSPYQSRDTGEVFLADTVRDLGGDLADLLDASHDQERDDE